MMEKGSFHTSSPIHSTEPSSPTTLEDVVRRIPLPNQLPQGVNFKDIPAAALKSSTLETLISQNEDLMARLTVSLRKANQFEEKAGILERENSVMRQKFETLREQFMVLQEKDRFASVRSHQLLEENGTNKEHMQKLEKVYSDLYVQAQTFQRRLQQLERYRTRIQKVAPEIQSKAKKFDALEKEFEQTRKTLSISHMQTVNSYEAKIAEVRQQLESFRDKAQERDKIFDEKVRVTNELVQEQRMSQTYRVESQTLLERLKDETAELRLQLKESLLAEESQKQTLADLSLEASTLKEENAAFRDQVESLQALWSHKQRELDQLEEKNSGLQKLNQSLSLNLNQQRKEIQVLQTELESERFSAQETLKTLNTEIEMLRQQLAQTTAKSESKAEEEGAAL